MWQIVVQIIELQKWCKKDAKLKKKNKKTPKNALTHNRKQQQQINQRNLRSTTPNCEYKNKNSIKKKKQFTLFICCCRTSNCWNKCID